MKDGIKIAQYEYDLPFVECLKTNMNEGKQIRRHVSYTNTAYATSKCAREQSCPASIADAWVSQGTTC